ncbi:hypothetical protein P3X46_014948 [Hevea brasiliensis]|uniref:NAC domain-containing protein n=1 Tax=Hevea brasiliensis TaxID=3981 RepID=A0ABQ9LUF4_HEVBR|nr:NAC domain-containing protein 71 [Hevea brasiliensis]KAJ9171607.1 hypothetical protein P3X46_014948 [Hevea brasiliensis]
MKRNFSDSMSVPATPEQSNPVVGYRFHPTDYELVNYFLKRKINDYNDNDSPITETKVCAVEPWDLPGLVHTGSEDQVWYFFCPRDYKYSGSRRSNRTTKAGYWKPTGKPRKVKNKRKEEIGTKRTLVFYLKDHPKPRRTKWIMHEYDLFVSDSAQGNFLLCKLKAKPDVKVGNGETSSVVSPCDLQNQKLNEMTTNSSSDECEPSNLFSDFENCNHNQLTTTSTYDQVEQNALVAFDHQNQNLNEVTSDSTNYEGESHYYYLSSDQEDQNQNEMAAMSTYVNGNLSGPITLVFGSQNPNRKTDISASEEGEWSFPLPTPSDTLTHSTAATVDNNAAESTPLEVDMQQDFLKSLKTFLELDEVDNPGSTLLSPMGYNESGFCTGFDRPELTGVGSEIGWVNEAVPLRP